MFSITSPDIKKLEQDLQFFKARAFPFATKQTLNSAAFQAQKIARADVKKDFINRNRFTVQSIQVEQTRTLNVNRQEAVIGSTADYMETQEFGGVKKGKGKHGVTLPTGYSANQEGADKRTKLPIASRRMKRIKLKTKPIRAKSKKQELIIKSQVAVQTGDRFFYHDFGGGKAKGIFQVKGGDKKQKRGMPKGMELKMVYDLSHKSVVIPRNPWLKPAFEETQRMIPAIYADALRFQLRRHGLFK